MCTSTQVPACLPACLRVCCVSVCRVWVCVDGCGWARACVCASVCLTQLARAEHREQLPRIFEYLQGDNRIKDFHLSMTTLEDVFLKIAEEAQGEEFNVVEEDR